ncbi:MAG: glycosyltransferase family 2 protein [Thermoproteota archaeon]
MDKPFVVAAIPAFNEERTIAKVVILAQKYVDKVIVCDDGSSDLTGEIAKRLGAEVIRHERNMGKGVALRDLFRVAGSLNPDIVVTLDADGQHDPSEIPRLIEPIRKGEADFVIGSRYIKGAKMDAPLYRKFGLGLINFFNKKLMNSAVSDTQSGFRAFTVKALEELKSAESDGFGIESEQVVLAIKKKLRIVEIPITIKYKGLPKTSKKSPLLHGSEIIATLLRLVVEEKPLLCLGVPGGILVLIAVFLGTYLLLLFNITRYFSLPIAIVTLGASFIGITLIVASLTLYGLNRVVKRIKG